jgi:TolB-like protein/Flp pilus assembly protein TadD
MQRESKNALRFGPYRIDREQRLVARGSHVIPLAPKIFDTLLALVESGGRLLEMEQLLKIVWPDSFVEEGSLTRNISTLRKVLGEGPDDQKYIATVPKRGYRFVAPVAQEGSGNGSSSDVPTAPAASSAIVWWRHHDADASSPSQSIAVMPLENLSGDASQDYFAEILTDALIGELARFRKLQVISGSAVLKYSSAGKPLSEIAVELQFGALVEGSVKRAGGRVQIVVRLVQPQTGRRLWSESYDRDVREILALQKEVAGAIAAELRAEFTPEQTQSGAERRVDPEAYDRYLRGRFYAQRQNREDCETSIASLESAVAIDPNFASAYAELAQAYVWKLFLFAPHERQWEEKAIVAIGKALSLDPDLAVAHVARGRLLWTPATHFPHDKAIREYRRALILNPNLDEARNQLALIYCHIGYFEQALQEAHKAVLTNPNNNLAVYRAAQTLVFQGEYEQALSVLRTIPPGVNPSLIGYQTAWVLFNLGRTEEAGAAIEQLLGDYPEDEGGVFTSLEAVLAASANDERRAEAKIHLAIETGKGFGHFHHTAYHVAVAYALLHKAAQAVTWLEAAAMDGFPCYPLFEKDANLDNLRGDTRFVEFMTTLKQRWLGYKMLF